MATDETPKVALWPLFRTFVGLKVNKVWPHAACIIVYGWRGGRRQWRRAGSETNRGDA